MVNQKKYLLIFVSICSFILFLGNSSNPPNGRTGAPGDGICSSCHSGSGGGFNGNISLSGLPSTVDPGVVYSLTYTVEYTMGTPVRAGLQSVALKDANNTNAGDFMGPGTGATLTPHNNREYLEHAPAKMFGGGTTVSYTVDWEAPNIDDDVTFYAASVLGNGSGSSGDKVLTAQFSTTVDGMSVLDVVITDFEDVTCFNEDDGTATAQAEGGVPPYDYEWENGETGPTAFNLDSGIHDVTVTDDAGNTDTAAVAIDEPDEINLNISMNDVSCFGEADGTADVSPSGGTGGFSCDWSNGNSGCSQVNLEEGTYFVTVEDSNGCTALGEVTIDEPTELNLSMSSTEESAAGAADGTATANPSGGTMPYDYLWSNGETDSGPSSTISNLAAGTYSVTVSDDNGCEIIGMVEVMSGDCLLNSSALLNDVDCNGNNTGSINITVMDGVDPITFNWSNGANTEDLNDIPAGNYSVTISDNGGCENIISNIIVSEPDALDFMLVETNNPECQDDTDGEIMAFISGGSPQYEIAWSNGVTNIVSGMETLSGLLSGSYGYTITDNNACQLIGEVDLPNTDTEAPTLLLKEAFIFLDANGNSAPVDFSLVDDGSFDNCSIATIDFDPGLFDCSGIGVYNIPVTITDPNGNSSSDAAVVNVIEIIPPEIDCSGLADIVSTTCDPIIYETPTATDNCDIVFVELTSGFESGSIFPSGETVVTHRATDGCGNFVECSFTVTVNIDLAVASTTTDASCNGANNGSISSTVTGGTPPYTTIISPPVSDMNMVPAGTYTITVTDDANCVAMEEVIVSEPEAITGGDAVVTPTESDSNTGAIDISPSGGTGNYTNFSWTDENGNIIANTEDVSDLGIGTYCVVITDSDGCISMQMCFEITVNTATIDLDNYNKLVLLSPNPSSDFIELNQAKAFANSIQIFSINGNLKKNIKNPDQLQRIDISDFSPGLYIIKISGGDQIVVKQFIKI